MRYADAGRMKDLACPPYDIISQEEQQALHDRDPYNAVRLELAAKTGPAATDRYAGVKETVSRWLQEGVLAPEPQPALYVYRQDFESPTSSARCRVVGVIGALELEELGASGVLPHERTMEGPKADRLALMRAVRMNVSPIYGIYRGAGSLSPFYASLEERPPSIRFVDEAQILHRCWVVTAPAEIEMLSQALTAGPLVIADGHHRYETALAFHREQASEGAHDAIMCFCVDADSEDLVVLPYNRAVKGAVRTASPFITSEAASPRQALESSKADHPYVLVLPDGHRLAEVSDDDVVRKVGERSPSWRNLDVVALHEVLLPDLFPDGIGDIVFTRDPEEVERLVLDDGWDLGVLLRPLDAPQIVEVAASGERMPQKASYFWPKALTGLVFRTLD